MVVRKHNVAQPAADFFLVGVAGTYLERYDADA